MPVKKPKPTVIYSAPRAQKTRREILNLAVEIASAEGLESLTIGRLADELEISKSGVFAHFGSKELLQLATVEAAKQVFIAQVVEPALKPGRGTERLRAMLESWLSYLERGVFRGGCFFAATAAEFDSRPGRVRDEIASISKAWLSALSDEIDDANSRGEISPNTDSAQLAFELHAYLLQANWALKLLDDKMAVRRARKAVAERLDRVVEIPGGNQNDGRVPPSH